MSLGVGNFLLDLRQHLKYNIYLLGEIMFFDINKLTKQARGNPSVMLKMLENVYRKKIPKNKRDMKYHPSSSISGDGFIENPEALFNSKADPVYKVQYLILLSKRDYLLFKTYGIRDLDLSFFPDLNTDALRGNPLVTVTNTSIKFNI